MSGAKRDCTCPRAHHEHGTRLAYVRDRCRCDECRGAATAAERARRRQKAYGRYGGLIDAEPARQHVRTLMASGIGMKQITRLGGPSGGVMCKLMYGQPLPDGTRRPPSRRITPRVADSIFAIIPETRALAGGALVDGTGTRRRVQALVVLGWSLSKIARMVGWNVSNFGGMVNSQRQVTASTARRIADLYEQLWDTRPVENDHQSRQAASRARRYAQERCWLAAMTWDDDTIDDPNYHPPGWTPPAHCDECDHTFAAWPALISHTRAKHGFSLTVPAQPVEAAGLDEIAVERYIAGTLHHVSGKNYPPELIEAVRIMVRTCPDAEIGRRIGLTGDGIVQLRSRFDIPSPRTVTRRETAA